MSTDEYKSLYGFGTKLFDAWRNFVLLEEIPAIQATHLPWMYALWLQVLILCIILIVWFGKLYLESKNLNNNCVQQARKVTIPKVFKADSEDRLYVTGLFNKVLGHYRTKKGLEKVTCCGQS